MIELENYVGREQAYVKHVFLENYLERLAHKAASSYPHIAYIDGFAGPWQSASERFDDTSFGVALGALRSAKKTWQEKGKAVQLSAFLVEIENEPYKKLEKIPSRFPDVSIRTYNSSFMSVLPTLMSHLPKDAFAFFFIDPKGWRIRLRDLKPLLDRENSEVVFNFMFDFINRAININDAKISAALDDLIPFGNWREKIQHAEQMAAGELLPEERKCIIVDAFRESLKILGKYQYVAETTILRPISDRPLYSLCYATRHPKGIEVFRECQIKALREQSTTRAATKLRHAENRSGQKEFFTSLHDMGPDDIQRFLKTEVSQIESALFEIIPRKPNWILYETLRAKVLERLVVKYSDVNAEAARLRKSNGICIPDWEKGKRVPQAHYRITRA